MKRILLAGAGHAHLVVLRDFAKQPLYGARLTIVSQYPRQVYSGMLPGLIAGHYRRAETEIDVARLAERAYAELVRSEVAALDPGRRVATLRDGAEIGYDFASLNVGSLMERSIPGAAHALAAKPFEDFVAQVGNPRRIAIAGAGAAGAEIAMALRWRGAAVTLYSAQPSMPPALARRAQRAMRRIGVDFRSGMPVDAIEPGPVVIAGSSRQEFDLVVLTTGAVAAAWPRAAGLATDERGFVLVDATLRSVSHPGVFAVGDCATLQNAVHARSGVYSVRHGEVLAANLRKIVQEEPLAPYTPQPRSLVLLSCGRRYAIAERGGRSAEGWWAWRWKNWIDRRWVRSFSA